MIRAAPWFTLFFAVSLLSGCAAEAGGKGKVTCGDLCEARGACPAGPGGSAGQGFSLEACLSACAGWPAACRDASLGPCVACWEGCDAGCADTACNCDGKRPGEPCLQNDECETGSICFGGSYCIGSGPLRVTLSYDVDSDFDLHLRTPAGNEIYFGSRDADGGFLDVDQCGPAAECGARSHVENIAFREYAAPGEYEVWAVNYNGRSAGVFRIDAATPDLLETFSGTLPARALSESPYYRFVVH